jgi:hypothetical protein
MKLGNRWILAALGVCVEGTAVAAGVAMAGCGGQGGSGNGDPGGTTCGNVGQPPCPTGGTTTTSTPHNYAVHQLFLGDLDPTTMQPNPDAWQDFGYNLDGKDTTASSTDVCTLVLGAPAKVQVDGPNGIDNSFGLNVVPIIVGLDSTASTAINTSINEGQFTVMTDVTGFDDSAGNTTSATGLTGVILAGADIADSGAPTWMPSFNWPVRPELLMCNPNCAANANPVQEANVQLAGAYQLDGTFVSGAPTQIQLALNLAGQTIQITVDSALITFQPDTPGHVKNGMIAGVIETSALLNSIRNVIGYLGGGSFCSGAALANIENEIAQKSDIVVNGNTVSNEPGTTCNAISVGLGFTADEIAQPTEVAPPSTSGTNPCDMDGGSD